MAYATSDDVYAIYDSKTVDKLCWNKAQNGPDRTRLDTALANASNEIDGYVSSRYPVPVNPAPMLFKQINIDLAIYYLALTHAALTDEIIKRADDWRKYLTQVAKGSIGLGVREDASPDDPTPAEGSGIAAGSFARAIRI